MPYKEDSTNLIYELLFCDNINLYKSNSAPSNSYPWSILFSDNVTTADLEKIANDENTETRTKLLAYNRLIASRQIIDKKELLAVIVEVGLDNGLDVLASYKDGSARYINQTGKIIIWEAASETSTALTSKLFNESINIVKQIGPWDKPRRQHPSKGMVRVTFLVSDGLYFGEGPINVLFGDPLANKVLTSAMELMKYLIEKHQ